MDTFIRLSLHYKIVYINKVLAIYHRDAENRACDLCYPSMDEYYPVRNLVRMMRNDEVPAHFKQSAIEYIAKHQLSLAKDCLHYGSPQKARKLIQTCSGTKIYRKDWHFLYYCTFIPPAIFTNLLKLRNKLIGKNYAV